jgi:hypothetical protein
MPMTMGIIAFAEDGFIALIGPGRVVVAMRGAEFEPLGESDGSQGGNT